VSTLIGAGLLTVIWYRPWEHMHAWLAAALFWAVAAGYVAFRQWRHPDRVIWGAADSLVAALTMVWLGGSWLTGVTLVLAAFGVQIVWSAGQWLWTRTVPTRWPWLVGFWGVWCLWHAVTGVPKVLG